MFHKRPEVDLKKTFDFFYNRLNQLKKEALKNTEEKSTWRFFNTKLPDLIDELAGIYSETDKEYKTSEIKESCDRKYFQTELTEFRAILNAEIENFLKANTFSETHLPAARQLLQHIDTLTTSVLNKLEEKMPLATIATSASM